MDAHGKLHGSDAVWHIEPRGKGESSEDSQLPGEPPPGELSANNPHSIPEPSTGKIPLPRSRAASDIPRNFSGTGPYRRAVHLPGDFSGAAAWVHLPPSKDISPKLAKNHRGKGDTPYIYLGGWYRVDDRQPLTSPCDFGLEFSPKRRVWDLFALRHRVGMTVAKVSIEPESDVLLEIACHKNGYLTLISMPIADGKNHTTRSLSKCPRELTEQMERGIFSNGFAALPNIPRREQITGPFSEMCNGKAPS